MEERRLVSEFVTGLSMIVLSAVAYSYSYDLATYILAILLAMGGLFLASSRFLIIWNTGMRKKLYIWMIIAAFLFIYFSFIPVWCQLRNVPGKELKYCFYEDMWNYFLVPG
jgi:hypothetical protein